MVNVSCCWTFYLKTNLGYVQEFVRVIVFSKKWVYYFSRKNIPFLVRSTLSNPILLFLLLFLLLNFKYWNFISSEGEHDKYRFEGLTEAPALDSDGECFTPILLNASSINVDVYYNKAVNYTLMVTFVSFLNELIYFILRCVYSESLYRGYLLGLLELCGHKCFARMHSIFHHIWFTEVITMPFESGFFRFLHGKYILYF